MKKLSKLDTRFNLEMSGDTKLYMVSAKQGDKATRYVIAKLLNDGTEYVIPEDAIVVVNVKKPDGKRVYNTCSASGSEVTIELTNQILAASGTAYCDVEVRTADDEQVITSASFTIEIEESMRSDSAILSSNEYTELERREKLRQEAEELRQQNEGLRQEAEEQRQRNEASRQTAEGQRQQDEALRQKAEEQRQRNETSRQTAEGQRQRNEASRQTAEGQRQQNVTQAIEDVNKASENCRKVTERAENALQSQEQLEETLNTAIEIKKSVEKDKEEIRANYGSCSTAAATAAKVVACTGFALATGSEITVKFTVTNTAANPTLNVNGTGAKPVYYRGAAIAAGYLAANRTYTFRYNGTQYELVGDLDTNTTYGNMGAATADAAGKAGLVPVPPKGAQEKYLRGDGTWQTPPMNTGPQGPKGDTGEAAGFGTPTATVDANVGTPSVTITASGSNTAKVFKFEFKNLKGAKGDKGDKGADGAETADASASVKGLVNTGAQTFGGDKTFNNAVQVNGGLRTKAAVEIFGATPYIDFHFNNSDADYTSRIVEVLSGVLRCIGKWQCGANLQMWTDAEGANIQMVAPDGSKYEVDTYGNGLRIYSINSNGTVANANILYSDLLGNISFSGKILANGSATSDECVRNIQLTTTDPGENVVATARNGSLIAVYE